MWHGVGWQISRFSVCFILVHAVLDRQPWTELVCDRPGPSSLAGHAVAVYLSWDHQLGTAYQVGTAGARAVSGSYEAAGYREMHQSYHLAAVSLPLTPISDGGHTTI